MDVKIARIVSALSFPPVGLITKMQKEGRRKEGKEILVKSC